MIKDLRPADIKGRYRRRSEEPKIHKITVRLTDSEKKELEEIAHTKGLSLATYMAYTSIRAAATFNYRKKETSN